MSTSVELDSKRLEDLARDFCTVFLRRDRGKVIGLYGHEPEVLDYIKGRMEKYFSERNKEVTVTLGQIGYQIDVGRVIISFSHKWLQQSSS